MEFDFSTYYRSNSVEHRIDEETIINKSIEDGVVPEEVHYGIMNGVFRGVIKSSNDILYYMHYSQESDNFRLVKASGPDQIDEALKLMKNCRLNCSLVKAGGGGAGSSPSEGSGGMNTIEEEADVADANELRTDRHPGAVSISTPDDPARGRMWHEQEVPVVNPVGKSWDAVSLLNGLNDNLRKSTEVLRPPVSDQEQKFMVEVLGRTPEQVRRGDTYMNPTQKIMYQQWVNKSLNNQVGALSDWLKGK